MVEAGTMEQVGHTASSGTWRSWMKRRVATKLPCLFPKSCVQLLHGKEQLSEWIIWTSSRKKHQLVVCRWIIASFSNPTRVPQSCHDQINASWMVLNLHPSLHPTWHLMLWVDLFPGLKMYLLSYFSLSWWETMPFEFLIIQVKSLSSLPSYSPAVTANHLFSSSCGCNFDLLSPCFPSEWLDSSPHKWFHHKNPQSSFWVLSQSACSTGKTTNTRPL